MTQDEMADGTERVFDACRLLRNDGQQEYAHQADNSFANFERVAAYLGQTREQTLMTYLIKHIDGIASHVKGHHSQREDVRGRIKDAIVYLCLLHGMIDEGPAK